MNAEEYKKTIIEFVREIEGKDLLRRIYLFILALRGGDH